MHSVVMLFIALISAFSANSQIVPEEGRALNYRLIGFQCPAMKGAPNCKLEIAKGTYYSNDSFKKNIIATFYGNKIVGEVPSFGAPYTWRVSVEGKGAKPERSPFYHFSTGYTPNVDTSTMRMRIAKATAQYRDAYVFSDGNGVLYDMQGHPVWYLPFINGIHGQRTVLRDLKLTPQGTITFMAANNDVVTVCEVDYNGKVLWKGPDNGIVSGDTAEHYHHEFTRLANGHYMVMGNEYILTAVPASTDSVVKVFYDRKINLANYVRTDSNNVITAPMAFGTLIEYDEQGKVVWSWKSSKYFKGSDLRYRHRVEEFAGIDVHDNAFYFDEPTQSIYVSYRNLNRIVKLKYPEGQAINTYGDVYLPGGRVKPTSFFCGQHCVRLSQKGYLYLFNNNSRGPGSMPKIIMMKEPVAKNDSLVKAWEYNCPVDSTSEEARFVKYAYLFGGSVYELPGNSFLVSLSGIENKMCIVDMNKKIEWLAAIESLSPQDHKWNTITQYRASVILNKNILHEAIWNSN